MQNVSAYLFALAALGGVVLATLHFRGKKLPVPIAVVHGAVAATGVVLLTVGITQAAGSDKTLGVWSLVLFLVAAVGGAVMFIGYHLRNRPLPSPFVVMHALTAVLAFILLLIWLSQAGSSAVTAIGR
jgi:hypothetical protein